MSGQQSFFDALLDPGRPCPDGVVAWNGSDPAVRFGIYRNNVAVALVDALADTFPVTQELVGEPFFRAMARVFATGAPPRSPVLARYGEEFPAFVAGFPPAAGLPYLADLARLELARVRAYHAADAPAVAPDRLQGLLADPDALPRLRLGLHPSVQVLRSPFAVGSLWHAHRGGPPISVIDPYRPEALLILRDGLDVGVVLLAEGAADLIDRLLEGSPLGEAAGLSLASQPDLDLAATLAILIRHHAIATID